jgi:hypothetical protein
MKRYWHEQIQRYMAGESAGEETAELQQALKGDAELRALYLDYANLDVALGAMAEAAEMTGNGIDRILEFPGSSDRPSPHYWRWLAATAACAALLILALVPGHRHSSGLAPNAAAEISSIQNTIAQISIAPDSSIPAWMSPTDSMLDPAKTPK